MTSKSKNPLLQALIVMSGQENVITVHRATVEFLGDRDSASMLEQLLYWTPRSTKDGWVAKTDEDWKNELFLSQYAIRKARCHLEKLGILETEVHRFNGLATVHYKLNLDALVERWDAFLRNQNPGLSKTQDRSCESERPLTEITAEITTHTRVEENLSDTSSLAEEERPTGLSHADELFLETLRAREKKEGASPSTHRPETKERYKELLAQAADKGMTSGRASVGHYPEHVRDTIQAYSEVFRCEPPRFTRRKGGEYAQWIQDAEDFNEACGNIDPAEVLRQIGRDFDQHKATHGGLAPFRVTSIRSLVKTARQTAGEIRARLLVMEKTQKEGLPRSFYG